MLRAAKKLITKLLCPNMKKSRNQRRLVIVVALVGVYFLGRHSSSLGMSQSGEEEKRFLRGPFRYRLHSQHKDTEHKETAYIVERVDSNPKQLQKMDSDSTNTEAANEILQRLANTVANIARDGPDIGVDNYNDSLDIHVDYEVDYTEEEPKATKLNNEKDTKSLEESNVEGKDINNGIDKKLDGSQSDSQTLTELPARSESINNLNVHNTTIIDTGNGNQQAEPKPSQTSSQDHVKQAKPIDKVKKNVVVSTVKPKPTVIVSKPPSPPPTQGSKAPSRKFAPSTSTVKPKEPASSRFAGGIKIQEILKDKKLFVLKSKENIEEQLLKMLKTLPYSLLLKRAAAGTTPPTSAENSTYDKYSKLGYNKELSDSLPLLRDLPDSRDIRYVAIQSHMHKMS